MKNRPYDGEEEAGMPQEQVVKEFDVDFLVVSGIVECFVAEQREK